ncbi:hypothetical protein CS022_12045 [Veronia nyctiphanis]|uniref:Acyltransferase 3 domain-containing protein n=1 Tax=Veronia nyctiphanis TaxID=1278244 RepID=A0A4Q0YVL8_9GAMM|nr:acyltransferase [Veronia nyctiphanis]RXJ73021.1 hypothetical protein CS022_12045 [Veronia nyctiphanis]
MIENTFKRDMHLDVLRCVAAFSVVMVHALWPYREALGVVPDADWLAAVLFNSLNRWGVPIFIMITGALMLSDTRPFEPTVFFVKRAGKVLVPFVVWSLLYAIFSGVHADGVNVDVIREKLAASANTETYYHLGFFYYFLPLYFVIPFLRPLVQRSDTQSLLALNACWLLLCGLRINGFDLGILTDLIYYSGYLVLGYTLKRYAYGLPLWLLAGALSGLLTYYQVVTASLPEGSYQPGNWLSYQTLNTVLVSAAVFMSASKLVIDDKGRASHAIQVISRYSLGIYLVHPLFLSFFHQIDPTPPHAWLVIPILSLVAFGLSLGLTWLLAAKCRLNWLVP